MINSTFCSPKFQPLLAIRRYILQQDSLDTTQIIQYNKPIIPCVTLTLVLCFDKLGEGEGEGDGDQTTSVTEGNIVVVFSGDIITEGNAVVVISCDWEVDGDCITSVAEGNIVVVLTCV